MSNHMVFVLDKESLGQVFSDDYDLGFVRDRPTSGQCTEIGQCYSTLPEESETLVGDMT
jgi:hypothetical protein